MRSRPSEQRVSDLLGVETHRLTLPSPVAVDVGVGEDSIKPDPQVGAGPERAERQVGLEVGLLDQVLGVRPVSRHTQGGAVELVQQWHRVPLEAGLPFELPVPPLAGS
jgi:hypothetical protein